MSNTNLRYTCTRPLMWYVEKVYLLQKLELISDHGSLLRRAGSNDCNDFKILASICMARGTYRISGNFHCKNIFVVAINHENLMHENIFTRIGMNSYYGQNLFMRC